ncbi:metallophosphoesterase [Marinobacter zhejiangensis]|uniref:Calcineurin-like phosphoesterase n=1 Tax=Marinobacter zhejiangensis TaxID=488535 RepID=A0A1I4MAQ9_9GAMM|nr:metallophosphoesterase [Marinobacter zhejiangensis]SFM00294.1 Calcineurin-like phosphoesterase [Marinobacter zhejiangensis]
MSMNRRKFIRNLLVGSATVPVITACGGGGGGDGAGSSAGNGNGGQGGTDTGTTDPGQTLPERTEALSFIVIGDMGTGTMGQYSVAAAMAKVAKVKGCDFVLGAGDNIYEDGVTSVDDPRFLDSFEYPYQNLDLPFYMCLGNHDCASTIFGGGSDNQRGNHQVDYHYSTERYSNKWRMPARYYNQVFGDAGDDRPFLELFVVDSNPLTSFYTDTDSNFTWQNYGYPQQSWMKKTVADSRAHWKIAMSHVPYKSNGKHGNAGNLDPGMRWMFTNPDADGLRYKAFMEECFADKADLLFTGHDHSLQWIEPVEEMGPAHIIVSGAAGKTDDFDDAERNPTVFQQENALGFVWVRLTETEMQIEFYTVAEDGSGHQLAYSQTLDKPVAVEPALA